MRFWAARRGVGRQILAKAVRNPKVLQIKAFLSSGDTFLSRASAKAVRSSKVIKLKAFLSFGDTFLSTESRPELKSAQN